MNRAIGDGSPFVLGKEMPILWYILKPEAQILLWNYQQENYGMNLSIPPDDYEPVVIVSMVERLPEIKKLMRRKPKYKGKMWHDQ